MKKIEKEVALQMRGCYIGLRFCVYAWTSDAELYTLKELRSKMSELAVDDSVYCLKGLKQKLQERYGNNLYFADEIEGKSNVVCFQNMID